MRFRFTLDGASYSKNKDAFKVILKRHGLGFRGSRDTFVWSSRQESVTATSRSGRTSCGRAARRPLC